MKSVRPVAAALVLAALSAMPLNGAPSGVFTRGPANCHAIALTFDLCPVKSGTGFDAPLVQFLIEHRVPATFFASGRWIAAHDAGIRELTDQPFFEIGTQLVVKTAFAAKTVTELRGGCTKGEWVNG